MCQRMVRMTDAGDGSRTEFSEIKRGLFLLLFYAKSVMNLFIFNQAQERGEGDETDIRAQQRWQRSFRRKN